MKAEFRRLTPEEAEAEADSDIDIDIDIDRLALWLEEEAEEEEEAEADLDISSVTLGGQAQHERVRDPARAMSSRSITELSLWAHSLLELSSP